MKTLVLFIAAALVFLQIPELKANNAAYQQRQQSYIDSALNNTTTARIVLQAYKNIPLDTVALQAKLNSISTGETSDFDIIELIRILYFSNGGYDAQILPVLNSVPYWINSGDTVRNYWSENHMIMWMSSDWLLHEKYNKPIDANLHARLQHYLDLKVQYGYYEFLSSVYAPYSLSGILNLVDFAQDAQIKSTAIKAAQRLLTDLLRFTNDKGVYFPVAGRNYPGKYETAYGQNHNHLIFLLTGLGQIPVGTSAAGQFLSTSALPVDSVISSWAPVIDTTYSIGHSLDTGFVINSGMSWLDKIIFQWSSGAYFHPEVVAQTVQLLSDSNMWNHVDFALLQPVASFVTPQTAPALANSLSCISKSSVICGETIQLFKHHAVALSSVPDFWKGKVGFQQHVCVANVGTTAVYTGSGEVHMNWADRNPNNANTHLPYVKQNKNVALLMYRPEETPQIIGANFQNKDVALHFKAADFDEIRYDSLWVLGRQANGYVAVRRNCTDTIQQVAACHTSGGQSWVIMVGDSDMYGSFNHFENIIRQSQFEEKWYFDSLTNEVVYYAKITADTLTVEYAWGVDTSTVNHVSRVTKSTFQFNLFPNPASNQITLQWNEFYGGQIEIRVYNTVGELIYFEEAGNFRNKTLNTSQWLNGIYFVQVETADGVSTKKVMIQR